MEDARYKALHQQIWAVHYEMFLDENIPSKSRLERDGFTRETFIEYQGLKEEFDDSGPSKHLFDRKHNIEFVINEIVPKDDLKEVKQKIFKEILQDTIDKYQIIEKTMTANQTFEKYAIDLKKDFWRTYNGTRFSQKKKKWRAAEEFEERLFEFTKPISHIVGNAMYVSGDGNPEPSGITHNSSCLGMDHIIARTSSFDNDWKSCYVPWVRPFIACVIQPIERIESKWSQIKNIKPLLEELDMMGQRSDYVLKIAYGK